MAEASQGPEKANKVPFQGDHDRVGMLSLKADGTADQHNPEIIVDKESALTASRRQFSEQAVSAADVEKRGAGTGSDTALVGQEDGTTKQITASDAPQDPSIEELTKVHDSAAKSGVSAAEAAVSRLVKD